MHLKNLVRSFPKPPITTQFRANQRAALFAVENLGGNKTGPSSRSKSTEIKIKFFPRILEITLWLVGWFFSHHTCEHE